MESKTSKLHMNAVIHGLAEQLVISQLSGTEAVGACYQYEIHCHGWFQLSAEDAVDSIISVSIKNGHQQRYIHGLVTQVKSYGKNDHGVYEYLIQINSPLYPLMIDSQCRVMNQLTVIDLVKTLVQPSQKFRLHIDVHDAKFSIVEQWVQFQESTWSFLERALARSGLFYYFIHHQHLVECVITNRFSLNAVDYSANRSFKVQESAAFANKLIDYLPAESSQPMITAKVNARRADSVIYPGNFSSIQTGKDLLQQRNTAAAIASSKDVYHLDDISYQPGMLLDGVLLERQELRCNTADHLHSQAELLEHSVRATHYLIQYSHNYFLAIRNPSVPPIQIAKVIGPKDQERYVDSLGRVKIKFIWEQRSDQDALKSCWVRVATIAAGQQRGLQFIPRIGDEVLVDFEAGLIERPIIIGANYNADTLPAHPLPDAQTQSWIRTKAKLPNNTFANEILFDDKLDAETIQVTAKRDFQLIVGKSISQAIKGNHLTAIEQGNYKLTSDQGEICLQAKTRIALKCGESIIELLPDKIILKSDQIALNP